MALLVTSFIGKSKTDKVTRNIVYVSISSIICRNKINMYKDINPMEMHQSETYIHSEYNKLNKKHNDNQKAEKQTRTYLETEPAFQLTGSLHMA